MRTPWETIQANGMDRWPVSKEVYHSLNYGELGAIILSENQGRWEWSSMVGNSTGELEPLLKL